MYRALTNFTDSQDNFQPYKAGDIFPRKGFKVSEERLAELSGSNNRRGIPVIEFVEAPEKKAEAPKKKRAKKTAE